MGHAIWAGRRPGVHRHAKKGASSRERKWVNLEQETLGLTKAGGGRLGL